MDRVEVVCGSSTDISQTTMRRRVRRTVGDLWTRARGLGGFFRARSLVVVLALAIGDPTAAQSGGSLRVEVTLDASLATQSDGRLLVVFAPDSGGGIEPRRLLGRVGANAVPTFGVDVRDLAPDDRVQVDDTAASFPLDRLSSLPAGSYRVQAVLVTNRDVMLPDAPGNLHSAPRRVTLDPTLDRLVQITLTRRIPNTPLPDAETHLRFVEMQSALLSDFHGRPIVLRAGVILPLGYDDEPDRRYPLRVHIGGYGSRYTAVRTLMRPGARFRDAWMDPTAPRMLLLHLDGAGPYGDPYQVNSANNGPYGDAITQELIPHIERVFRAVGTPRARVLDGSSTGGWVALALKIFYPRFFNAVWASCPDSVDFRAFQLVDIYRDNNAYVDARGQETPSARNRNGSVRFTMRHEVRAENVLGIGDNWTTSGRQWGAWNAAYGPRSPAGHPIPLWDPQTGVIDRGVVEHWEAYDLRLVLSRNWDRLSPELSGKLNIWVGDRDDYFLDGAVRHLERFLRSRRAFDARIAYGAGSGHCWTGISEAEMLREMSVHVSER